MADIEDLYREIILDHYRSPRNKGELPVPPAVRSEGFNPLCGDEITMYLDVDDGVVADVKITAQGCSISQSSASMLSMAIKGKPVAAVRDLAKQFLSMMHSHESTLEGDDDLEPVDQLALGDLAALQGVVKFPPRIKCATLAWFTLSQGLDEAEGAAAV
jgi:nitrogen fixation NifU-like protein